MTEQIDWDKYGGSFKTLPNLSDFLKKPGNKVDVEFTDEGKTVTKEQLAKARERKGIPSKVKPVDNFVFSVKNLRDSKEYALWVKHTQFTNLRELSDIREGNGKRLVGARCRIEKLQSGDASKPSLKFSKL